MASRSKSKKQKYISYILRFCIIGVVIFFIGRGQQWDKLAEIFLDLNLWIFALAIACYTIGQMMVALRWYLLLRTQHIHIGLAAAVRLHFLGLFYNNALPGAVGGDFVRAWYATKHTEKRWEAALSVFVDRGLGLMGMIVMAAFSYWILPLDSQIGQLKLRPNINFFQSFGQSPWIALSIAAGAATMAVLFLLTGRGQDLLRIAHTFMTEKTSRAIVKTRSAFELYCGSPLTIIWAFIITIICQILQIVGLSFVGENIGIPAPTKYYFVFLPISWVIGALPISPGGAAVVEGGLVFLFTRIPAVMPEQALALALYQRLAWLIASLPGAGIHLAGAHLPKQFSIDYDKSVN